MHREQKPLPNVGKAEPWDQGLESETIPENTVKRSEADLPVLLLCPKEKKVGGREGGKIVVNKLVLMM